MSELSEAIILVLSPACRILFCGHAVQELLGWKDEELIDWDLVDLMNGASAFLVRWSCGWTLRWFVYLCGGLGWVGGWV